MDSEKPAKFPGCSTKIKEIYPHSMKFSPLKYVINSCFASKNCNIKHFDNVDKWPSNFFYCPVKDLTGL